jgi:predicted transcriptional regulator
MPRNPVPPAVVAGAAATLAAVPGATVPKVAEALGMTPDRLRRAIKADPAVSTDPLRTQTAAAGEIAARAHQAVNLAQTELAGPDLPTVGEAAAKVAGVVAVDVTQRVLARHRDEWKVPRGLLGEAVKARDFEKAKLARIVADTLTLVQQGERTAHGIKAGDIGTVVEIDYGDE